MREKMAIIAFAFILVFAASTASRAEDYVIGEEDALNISVWGSPELSVHVPVKPDGMISVPLVGEIKAAGMTPSELKAVLEQEFSRFAKAPTVSVIVTEVNSFKVYLLGEGITRTASTGVMTLKRKTTLLQLLAQLGSLKGANLNAAFILREGKKLPINFSTLVNTVDVAQDIALRPNDIIVIPETVEQRIKVVGEVKTPGLVPFAEGMTALDAVLSAGGFTNFASQNSVVIVRKEGKEVREIEARLKDVMKGGDLSKNVLLRPGDLITVKSSIF
ncbi:MAG: polysaccharide biosynthesis/export family protein [Nitrospirota bacterium]